MQEPFDDNEEKLDDIRMENEIKKIKLSLEHGMDFSKTFLNPDLPPEVEGDFLDYIQEFEQQFSAGRQVKVYDFIAQPAYIPAAEIKEEEIATELSRLQDLMQQHNIHLDTLCPVDDKELYRFITEELFLSEVNDIRIEGMMHGFIYEEFHPNHEYDIKNRCREVIERMLNKDWEGDMITFGMHDHIDYDGRLFTKEELNEKMMNFRNSFSAFDIHVFELDTISINEAKDNATAVYTLGYSATIDGSPDIMRFSGKCTFGLISTYDWWHVNKISVPGLTV